MLLSRIDRALSGNAKTARDRAATADGASRASSEANASVIGERFEIIQDSLEELQDMAQRFGRFESVLTQLREPLVEEFNARRDSHIELINLRSAKAEMGDRVEALSQEARELTQALAAAEGQVEELEAKETEHLANLQEARLELDRLRSEISQAHTRLEAFETSDAAATQRIRELEQDQQGLREQLRLSEDGRAQAEATLADIQRDHALALEEIGSLRRRLDEVGLEAAALARAAAAGEGQLATERARAAAEQAESLRAQRTLESQAESARAEIASLTARLDAATARSNGLDILNGEQTARLNELKATAHEAERRAESLQVGLDRALERIKTLEAAGEEARQRQAAMEVARLAAVDRAETLAKAATAHDKAISRAEDRMLKIQAKLAAAQDEHQAKTKAMTQEISALRGELEGARAEASMTAAALEAARRERGGRGGQANDSAGTVQSLVG